MGIIFSVLFQAISGSSQTQTGAEAEASSCSSQTSKPLSQYYSQSQLEAFAKTEELKQQTQTQELESEHEHELELELEKNVNTKERKSQEPKLNKEINLQLNSSSANSSNLNTITITKRKSKPELLIHKPVKNINIPENSTDSIDTVIHEFIWKYGGKSVQLAGTFTDWQPSIFMVPLDPQCEYWKALVELDPKVAWEFKFVVDGIWRCSLDLPTITDPHNNTNNIIYPE